MDQPTQRELARALFDAHGRPMPIDRIELEPSAGLCRWSLWRRGRRVFSCTCQPIDVPAMLEGTQLLVESHIAAPAAAPVSPWLKSFFKN